MTRMKLSHKGVNVNACTASNHSKRFHATNHASIIKITPSHPQKGKQYCTGISGYGRVFDNIILLKKGLRAIIEKAAINQKTPQEKSGDWVFSGIGGNSK